MPESPQRAVVVGGGVMGAGIAAIFAAGGWRVDVVSRSAATRDAVPGAVARAVATLGRTFDPAALTTRATLDEPPWSEVDIVVEAVTEDLALKRSVFADLERLARPDTPLASNTSSLPIGAIGAGLATRRRVVGLHFFMPAHLVPLVEVIRAPDTDPAVAEAVGATMASLGKRPVQVRKDVIGFLGNRIQSALMREALWLIEDGVASAEDVDATVRLSFGFRYAAAGPILQKEHSGWDTTCAVSKIIWPDLSKADGPPPVLQRNVDAGRIGFKSGRGFFEWTPETIAEERARYERALLRCMEIFREEGLI